MRKRLISFFIILSMLTIPSVTRAESDINEQNLLDVLGISMQYSGDDGIYLKRSDAAKFALEATNHKDVPNYESFSFADVSAQTKNHNEIEYCLELGIVAESELFNPDALVTISEFSKMVCCALGYGGYADVMGGYPSGYLSIAQQCGFYRGIDTRGEAYIKYTDADGILANILVSDYIPHDKFENDDKCNVLYRFFDIYRVSGIVTKNEITGLLAPVGTDKNCIEINNEKFSVSDDVKTEMLDAVGYSIDAWVVEDNDNTDRIVCYRENSKMRITQIDSDDFQSIKDGKLIYYENDREKIVNLPIDCGIIFNGEAISEEIDADVFKERWGRIKLIKADGNNVSVISIKAYDNYFVSSIDAVNYECFDGTRDATSSLPQNISFKGDNEEIAENTYFFDNVGNLKQFSDISLNSVISVAKNKNNIECIITNESISGKVDSIESNYNKNSIRIDNNLYYLSREIESSRSQVIRAGNEYTFYLDANGRIAAAVIKKTSENELMWAYLLDMPAECDEQDRVIIKAVTPADGRVSLPCAEKVKIDGRRRKGEYEVLAKIFKDAGDDFIKQLVRFSVNENGEINQIDTTEFDTSAESESNSLHLVYDGASTPTYFKTNLKSFGMQAQYSANTVVFYVPVDGSKLDDYIVVPISKFVTDKKYSVKAYSTDKYSLSAEAIVCYDNVISNTPMMYQDYLTVVTDISVGLNEDDEVVTKIKGYQKDSEMTWDVLDSNVLKIDSTNIGYSSSDSGNIKVGVGDTIRFNTDKDGYITNIQLIYDCSEREFHMPKSPDTQSEYIVPIGNGYAINEIGMVIPFRMKDGGIMCATDITRKPNDRNQKYIVMNTSYFKIYEVDATGRKPTVRKISASEIKTWYDNGAVDEVLCKCRYDEGRNLIVYKK